MITRKMSIENLLAAGIISPETAYEYSFDAGRNEMFEDATSSSAPPGRPQNSGTSLPGVGRKSGSQGLGGTAAFLKNRR